MMGKLKLSREFLKRLKAVTKRRPKVVIEHILKHGHISTEELQREYGYEHPPRAARDVREEGIPLETFRVKNAEGRSIAAYRFGDPSAIRNDRTGGRKVFSKKFKNSLLKGHESKCHLCLQKFEGRYLQIDHRVPYEVSGDTVAKVRSTSKYMLLCGACNRAKSWSCEHCINWKEEKSRKLCETCYWARPGNYSHIALRAERRLDLVWTKKEVSLYERLKEKTRKYRVRMPDYVKELVKKHLDECL